jgi:hypothetical protein
VSTEPDDDPSAYPDSWKTADIRRREADDTTDHERWLSSLSPAELALTLRRVRGGQ